MLLGLEVSLHAGAVAAEGDDPMPAAEASDPAAGELEDLMSRLAMSGGVRARFRETKHLALLMEPLETEGLVYFAPPDNLARHTTRPGRSSVVVRGNHVGIRDEAGTQTLELGPNDAALPLVDTLRALLRGDLAALQSRYAVALLRHEPLWQLRLVPRSQPIRGIVESIQIDGRGVALVSMEILETSGDRTTTRFSDVETGREFTPAELEEFFALEPPDAAP